MKGKNMENHGRKYFVRKNLIYGLASQVLVTIFPFISRTVFINTLGKSYLGISGLFTSILTVLSLAELGLGNIVIYSLYKPVAEGNEEKIVAYTQFYKKLYSLIALVVFVGGMAVIPFLDKIVNLPEELPHITLYYILYVVNSAVSYLFVYKASVIRAAQMQYLVSLYTTIFIGLMHICQVVVLLVFKSFTFYLLIQIAFTFLQNYALSREADKSFPYLNKKNVSLSKEERKKVYSDVKSMFAYKLGGVLLNSTDNIFISVLINTVMVGVYNNYVLLINVLNKVINIVYDAIYTSVGNLNATADKEKKERIFEILVIVFVWIATFGSVGIIACVDDILFLWVGQEYVSDIASVIALTINFYLPIVLYPIWMYRNTTGLFKETNSIMFIAAIINLILSAVLGKLFGLAGILIATSASRILTSFWYEPYILCKKMFTRTILLKYMGQVFSGVLIGIVSICVIAAATACIETAATRFLTELVLSCFIPNALLLLVYLPNKTFRSMLTEFAVWTKVTRFFRK